MKAFFLDDFSSKHVFLCNDEYNPAGFIANIAHYKTVTFPDVLTDVFNGKYGNHFPEGVVISYTANQTQLVNLHIDSFNITSMVDEANIVYVIGNDEDFKLVRSYFLRNIRAGFMIKPFHPTEEQNEIIKSTAGIPMLMKNRLGIEDANLLLQVMRGPIGGFCIWDLFSNRVFATTDGGSKNA